MSSAKLLTTLGSTCFIWQSNNKSAFSMRATAFDLLLVLQPLIVMTTNCAGNERLRSSSVWVLAINRLFDSHIWYSHRDGFEHVIILYIRTHQLP
ncbi:hypothetical protein [Nostoc favosum]|uniref:Uncharacterized protein n=1 Tax=Nostoc favosum CHAB5714 TaxID=2780399 RepID=A0ABS8IG78_9NOSO|nr:hypothetical protein [Nostoc favosum]MCC5603051.1 hypothetical protein [Nostoc favosum CHAB5714]